MSTSQKRTNKKTSTLEINFDQVDRRNCYIEAQKLGSKAYMDTRFTATSTERYFGRRDTLAKYNVPRRYRPSFWKGWRTGWRTAWLSDHTEKNVAFEKEMAMWELSQDATTLYMYPTTEGAEKKEYAWLRGCVSDDANPDKAMTKLHMEEAAVLNT